VTRGQQSLQKREVPVAHGSVQILVRQRINLQNDESASATFDFAVWKLKTPQRGRRP